MFDKGIRTFTAYRHNENIKQLQVKKYNKKNGWVVTSELVQSSRLPQLTSFPCGFVHSTFLAGGVPHSLSWPPRFSQSTDFLAETSLPKEGASAIARTAAMPIARNIEFLLITLH
jgi:hypothetical protein